MIRKKANAAETSALAKIGLMPEFSAIEKYAEERERVLGIQSLGDRETDPVKRKENGDVAYGEVIALRKLVATIKEAAKQSEDEEDAEDA